MEKGQTNNPNGRPKGVPNRTTKELREMVNKLFASGLETLEQDLKLLEPSERVKALFQLLPFVLPKPTETPLSLEERKGIAEYKGETFFGSW